VFSLKLAESIFVIFSLLFFSGGILGILTEQGITLGYVLFKFLPYVIGIISIILMTLHWKRVISTITREKLLWVLLATIFASAFASDMPIVTLRREIVMMHTVLFAVYFATCYSAKEQLRLLAWMLGLATVLSLIFGLALPSYGRMGMGGVVDQQNAAHQGLWRGIFPHKNYLSRIMVLSTLVFSLLAASRIRYHWVAWVCFYLSIVLILLSTSKSALVILVGIIAILPCYRALRWNYTIALPFFITVILVSVSAGVLLIENAEGIANALGRDLSLTGRTDIWIIMINKIQERPWLGYGYDTFWRAGWDGGAADVWSAVGYEPPHAHNGLLDLALDTGLLGASLFVLSFLTTYLRAVNYVRITKTSEGLFPIAYLTFLLLVNLTESSLLKMNIFWLIYIVVVLSMDSQSEKVMQLNTSELHKLKKKQRNVKARKRIKT
jgi:O-antigen ligase